MKEVINNKNKHKLKYWFAMLYIHGRKFMVGSVFSYQGLRGSIHTQTAMLNVKLMLILKTHPLSLLMSVVA